MRNLIRAVVVLLAFASSFVAASALPKLENLPEPTVTSYEFGVFDEGGGGNMRFTPTKVVPLVAGHKYGWVIHLEEPLAVLQLREQFTLPTKPATWGPPEKNGARTISADGRTSTVDWTAQVNNNVVYKLWSVAEGDPPGHYNIKVYLEGALVSDFKFDVQKPD